MIRAELEMLLNPQKHFASPVELRGNPRIRMKRRLQGAAEFCEILDDRGGIGIVRGEGPFIGQRPTAEKFFRLTRHRYFVAIGMMDFIALAAAGAASIICWVCCCCCRPWRIFWTVSQLLRHRTGTA